MLELDVLRVADVYAWLGCQTITARKLGCNQSTVSRRAREAKRLEGLRSTWDQETFLQLEREVHQCWRFSMGRDLRVHAYRWINLPLQRHLPESWMQNPAEVSLTRVAPQELLRQRVIDALLAPWPLVADLDRDLFAIVPIYVTPLLLLAPRSSLLSCEAGLSGADISRLSDLGTLDFVPAVASDCSRHLDTQLFGVSHPGAADVSAAAADPPRFHRYWGTLLTLLVRPELMVVDDPSPVSYGEFLVCRHEWRDHAEILRLQQAVRRAVTLLPLAGGEREQIAVA